MEKQGLLFIPDISGFTKFVNEAAIDHSRMIIQELLEIIINSNEIGLEVSEVEGDAILFYKFGDAPDIDTIYRQVAGMFCNFHKHLISYEHRRFCQCDACRSAIGLTLKVITHYGEFTGYTIKNFNKLIGKDLIVAHRLLKNDIGEHEYWLITEDLFKSDIHSHLPSWVRWQNQRQSLEGGDIAYQYTALTELKKELPPDKLPDPKLQGKKMMLSVSRDYDVNLIVLFHASGDFHYRNRWQEGIKSVEEVDHMLPRLGMRCRCIMENGESIIYASSYSYQNDYITFTDTDESTLITTAYHLRKLSEHRTNLTIEYHYPKSLFGNIFFSLFNKEQRRAKLVRSMKTLEQVAREIHVPKSN